MTVEDRLSNGLADSASRAPSPGPWAEFVSKAHSRVRRRMLGVAVTSTVVVAVGGLAAATVVDAYRSDVTRVTPISPSSPTTNEAPRDANAYPLLVETDSFKVFAPAWGQPYGLCPTAPEFRTENDLDQAKRVMAVAIPALFEQVRGEGLDVRDASIEITPAGDVTTPGLSADDCGQEVQRHTLVVTAHFPHVKESASMSAATFYLVREERGWVVWHWPS